MIDILCVYINPPEVSVASYGQYTLKETKPGSGIE